MTTVKLQRGITQKNVLTIVMVLVVYSHLMMLDISKQFHGNILSLKRTQFSVRQTD